MTDTSGLDPAVGELLSALLDGEVTPEERALAEQWLSTSPEARAEYDELARVRSTLRGLPMVEPRPGFLESLAPATSTSNLIRGPQRWFERGGTVVASAAATAAAWLVLGGVETGRIRPPVEEVSVASVDVAGLDGLHVRRLAGTDIAVLRQEGQVDWGSLPEGERPSDDVWVDLTTAPGEARVVVADGGVVWTLASEELSAEALVQYGEELPGGGESLVDRAREACEALLDAFGLGAGSG